jgi:hypothetical protein
MDVKIVKRSKLKGQSLRARAGQTFPIRRQQPNINTGLLVPERPQKHKGFAQPIDSLWVLGRCFLFHAGIFKLAAVYIPINAA